MATRRNRWHPEIPPVVMISSGDTVRMDIRDAVDGQITYGMTVDKLSTVNFGRCTPSPGPGCGQTQNRAPCMTFGHTTPALPIKASCGSRWSCNCLQFNVIEEPLRARLAVDTAFLESAEGRDESIIGAVDAHLSRTDTASG